MDEVELEVVADGVDDDDDIGIWLGKLSWRESFLLLLESSGSVEPVGVGKGGRGGTAGLPSEWMEFLWNLEGLGGIGGGVIVGLNPFRNGFVSEPEVGLAEFESCGLFSILNLFRAPFRFVWASCCLAGSQIGYISQYSESMSKTLQTVYKMIVILHQSLTSCIINSLSCGIVNFSKSLLSPNRHY